MDLANTLVEVGPVSVAVLKTAEFMGWLSGDVIHLVRWDAVADQGSDPGRDIEHPAVLHSLLH